MIEMGNRSSQNGDGKKALKILTDLLLTGLEHKDMRFG